MKILSCKSQHGSYLELTLEDGQVHSVHRETAAEYNLLTLTEIPEDTLSSMLFDNDVRRGFQRALYLLDMQDYSFQMMFRKLNQNYDEEVCYAVMDKLCDIGVINDWKYGEAVIRKAFEVKHYGPRRIREILYQKGIPAEVITKLMRLHTPDFERQIAQILQLLKRKYSRYLDDPDDLKKVKKAKSAIFRMGYGYGLIDTALKDYFKEAEYDADSEYEYEDLL